MRVNVTAWPEDMGREAEDVSANYASVQVGMPAGKPACLIVIRLDKYVVGHGWFRLILRWFRYPVARSR